MKIAAVCCTYLRPKTLGHLIRCFQLQDYPVEMRELIILDDAGQYGDQQGEQWKIISTSNRFETLGEKRNAATDLIADDTEAIAVWDDDDLYLPWALSASVAALQQAQWSRPSLVLHPQPDGSLQQHETGGLFHGGWAYHRKAFHQVHGYPARSGDEDKAFAHLLEQAGIDEVDPIQLGQKPFYIYPWASGAWRLGNMGSDGYEQLGLYEGLKMPLVIADPPKIDLHNPIILPGIHPRKF